MYQLILFIKKQLQACLFPVLVFGMLGISHLFSGILPRYDFMLAACITAQLGMFYFGLETMDEVWVICLFHLLGLLMELFKVHYGSWSYPEFAYTKIGGVPLYSGFMYASVASYMCQAWRRFDLGLTDWPKRKLTVVIGLLIYVNFFTNHFIPDIRYFIAPLIIYSFWRSAVRFHINNRAYRMPVILSFMLIGFFIWLAENVATRLGAWKYAYQHSNWTMVNYQKISSWGFLVIVSYIIIAELKLLKTRTAGSGEVINNQPLQVQKQMT